MMHLVGLSRPLMTTTLKSMEETIRALHDAKLDCKIMVGGAVLTPPNMQKRSARTGMRRMPSAAQISQKNFLGYKEKMPELLPQSPDGASPSGGRRR